MPIQDYTFSGVDGDSVFANSFGDAFAVGAQAIEIVGIGCFVDPAVAPVSTHVGRLYTAAGALLATVSIAPGDVGSGAATLVGQYAFKAISPVTFAASAGFVTMADGYATDKWSQATKPTFNGGSGLIAVVGSAIASAPNTFEAPNTSVANYGGVSIQYQLAGGAPSFGINPATGTTGTSVPITATGSSTAWTSGTTFSVAGGTGASISGLAVNVSAQTATFNLNVGTASGTLTISDSTDSATASFTANAPAALAGAPITVVSAGPSSWTLRANSTGGAGSLSYQWQSCPTPDGSFANIAGATSQTATIPTNGDGTPLFIQCLVIRGGSTVTSFGYVAGALWTNVNSSTSAAYPLSVVPVIAPTRFVICGDSTLIAGNLNNGDILTALQNGLCPAMPTQVTLLDIAQVGTTVQGWAASQFAEYYTGPVSGVLDVFLNCFGINDSKATGANPGEQALLPAASFATLMGQLCGLQRAASSGSRSIVLGTGFTAIPTAYAGEWTDASVTLQHAYNATIPGLANGTTILADPQPLSWWQAGAANPTLMVDGVHETGAASAIRPYVIAGKVIAALTAPASSGSGSGVTDASVQADVTAALVALGFTSALATQIQTNLNATVSSRSTLAGPAGFSSLVIAGGGVSLNLAQAVPLADNTAVTAPNVGNCLNAAHSGAAGPESRPLTPGTTTGVLRNNDGSTFRTFTYDSGTSPSSRS